MQRLQPTTLAALRSGLQGDLCTDRVERQLVATDGSIFEIMPAAVVYPASAADVVHSISIARCYGLSVHARGAGSGLCGAALGAGIVLDFTRYMNRLNKLDIEQRTFVCQPGYRLGELNTALRGSGLFFPPDPSSGEFATFGGMTATNASGAHSVKYGHVVDYLLDAQLVLADGRILRLSEISATAPSALSADLKALYELFLDNEQEIERGYPQVASNSAGYNLRRLVNNGRLDLRRLLCGAEGTLAIATELTFGLKPAPLADSLVVAYFDDSVAAAQAVQLLMPTAPAGIEIMDSSLLELARRSDPLLAGKIPSGFDNLLLVEYDAENAQTAAHLAQQALDLIATRKLSQRLHLAVTAEEKARFWAVRKAAVPILYRLKGRRKILAIVEDAAVPIKQLVTYVRGVATIMRRMKIDFVWYGHIAKGLIHTRPLLNLKDSADVEKLKPLADDIFALVNGLGGTISGEHGDGPLRSTYLRRQYAHLFGLMVQTKRILDPYGLLNPDIKTQSTPRQMQHHLRFGSHYRDCRIAPHLLRWPEGLTNAVEMCHGCSKCTTVTTATRMCPIYKFTRLEAATPKAKANVLRALISGKLERQELYQRQLQAVIDHCVGCGSCQMECPSHVDIPKMAMEAAGQFKRRFGPSRSDFFLAHPEAAGRYLSSLSGAVDRLSRTGIVKRGADRLIGLSRHRRPPTLARQSLFDRIEGSGNGTFRHTTRVLYFSGCYAGYMRPEIGLAAHRVLQRLGYQILVPDQHCCGLPMLAKGLINRARGKLKANQKKWQDLLSKVSHVVVTCSSCGLMLQKEWAHLDGGRFVASVAAKLVHISRLINDQRDRLDFTRQTLHAAYHMPCHLKLQPDAQSSLNLLESIPGMVLDFLDSHCCGMAGSWGMRADTYALSARIGGNLITKLSINGAELALTDCPTCRLQLEDLGSTPVRHPIEVVAAALK